MENREWKKADFLNFEKYACLICDICMQICMENKWVFEWVKHEMYEVEM